jgi:hypothetical protein
MVADTNTHATGASTAQNNALMQRRLKARQDEQMKIIMQKHLAMKTAALTELLRIALAEEISLGEYSGAAISQPRQATYPTGSVGPRERGTPTASGADEAAMYSVAMKSHLAQSGSVRFLVAEHYTQMLVSIIKKDTVELQVWCMLWKVNIYTDVHPKEYNLCIETVLSCRCSTCCGK